MKRILVDVRSIDDKLERLQQQLAIALGELIRAEGLSADELVFAPQKARAAGRPRAKRTTRRVTRAELTRA